MNYSKKLNHGEAVILGLRNAIKFSYYNKLLSKEKFQLINKHIKKIGILHKIEKLFKKKHIKKIVKFMESDKKNSSDKINLILMEDFGKIKTNFQIKSSELKKYLSKN